LFRGLKKSTSEKANEHLGKARLAAQRQQYEAAAVCAEKAIDILKDENNRKQIDVAKALYYEYLGMNSIKFDKALEAANYLGRSGGFYHRLGMITEYQRVFEKQAKILRVVARQLMQEKRFVEAGSYFERAAMAYQRLDNKAEELDCKAKSYISRAAAEKNISGRKSFLKKAVELIEEKGSDEPIIKAHLAYYNALFVEDEKPKMALKYYTEALQNYQLAGSESRIQEIKEKVKKLTEKQ
jgi:tetratricopeptide (TPR) repeat protein